MNNIRKSTMNIGELYFYTFTIVEWKKLLKPDTFKDIIINTSKYQIENKLIEVLRFGR